MDKVIITVLLIVVGVIATFLVGGSIISQLAGNAPKVDVLGSGFLTAGQGVVNIQLHNSGNGEAVLRQLNITDLNGNLIKSINLNGQVLDPGKTISQSVQLTTADTTGTALDGRSSGKVIVVVQYQDSDGTMTATSSAEIPLS